tara:strand:+ start:183 stop:395 length:213 start_codon:yes stop_codon:yes gene_type:complete
MNINNIIMNINNILIIMIIILIVIIILIISINKNKNKSIEKFIPSKFFIGSKIGYVYKMDKNGLGYYLDK